MKPYIYALLLSLGLTLNSLPGYAEVKLDSQLIENWISSQKALQRWGDKHGEVLDKIEAESEPLDNPSKMTVERMVGPLKKSGLYGEAKDLLADYDFDSPEQWAETTLKIVKSAASIQMQEESGGMQMPNMDEINQMLSSPQIPEEQKQMMRKMMEESMAMMKSFTEGISESDVAAVRPYMDRIQKAMEESEKGAY